MGVIGECFTHGQLYVAASRVGNPAHLRFAIDSNDEGEFRTRNIVFREALTSAVAPPAPPMAMPPAMPHDLMPERPVPAEVPPPHDYDEERLNRPESPSASGARRAPSPTPGADAESCACSAGFDGASASGLRVDVCPCCDERAPLDPFSNLCVPCEADACD